MSIVDVVSMERDGKRQRDGRELAAANANTVGVLDPPTSTSSAAALSSSHRAELSAVAAAAAAVAAKVAAAEQPSQQQQPSAFVSYPSAVVRSVVFSL